MIKSLNIKILLIFLGAIAVGLGSSIPITVLLFKDQLTKSIQNEYAMRSSLIADVLSRQTPAERSLYLKQLSEKQKVSLTIYDRNGLLYAYGQTNKSNLTDEDIRRVQEGTEVVKRTSFLPTPTSLHMGFPIQTAEGQWALVIHPESSNIIQICMMMGTLILIALVIGNFKFILLTSVVVKPLKALTTATKKIAGGDYNIDLRTKSSDELGVLSDHFQQMAHEISQVERMRQLFVSNVSHEIQTPLASI